MDIKHNFSDKHNRRLSRNAIARAELGQPRYLTTDNSTYEQRITLQLRLWHEGHPVHNDVDNECCPDFSCCRGKQHLASGKLRDMFVNDPASRPSMLQMFVSELPDEMRMQYDIPGQAVFRLEPR